MIPRTARFVTLVRWAILFAAGHALAAPTPVYRWTTLAGRASIGSEDGSLTDARFNEPHALALDSAGNLYVADAGNHTIRRITPAGIVSTFAGKSGEPGATDGPAASARFRSPRGLAVDRNGNVYVADTGNHTIRLITPAGAVSTIAGQAGQAGAVDGAASVARFDSPDRLAVDQRGNLYLSNHGIRKISGGNVTTLSIPAQVTDPDGNTLTVRIERCPAIDADDNLYFATINPTTGIAAGPTRSEQYLKVSSSGAQSIVRSSYSGTDNSGNTYGWRFYEDTLFNDFAGRLFTVVEIRARDYLRSIRALRLQPDGTLLTDNILEMKSHLGQPVYPTGLAQDAAGKWYFTRATDSSIQSGNGIYAGTELPPDSREGSGPSARLLGTDFLALDRSGTLWLAETVTRYDDYPISPGPRFHYATRVRKLAPSGLLSTPPQPASWSAMRTNNPYLAPNGIWVDQSGTVTVARLENYFSLDFRLNQIFADGTVTEMTAPSGYTYDPIGDNVGNLYVLNHTNVFGFDPPPAYDRIARRESAGTWTTLAGGPSNEILDGTGTAAHFKSASKLTLDRANNLYLIDRADADAHFIRKITTAGVVTTVSSKLTQPPGGLAVGASGAFYLTYPDSHFVTRLDAHGTETIIGGTRNTTGSLDGTAALFAAPGRIAVDAQENLYVIDADGTTMRKGEFLGYAPEIATHPVSTSANAGVSVTFAVTVSVSVPVNFQWYFNGTALAGATSNTLTVSNVSSANAGDYTVVVSNSIGSVTSNKATLTVNTPSTPTPPSGGGTGGGGGGAPSDWFAACVASALLIRAWRQRGR
ncbi:MAG: immunoglobulin domain-containing protein [Opitutae bacterium]|nr:immunoglobulin domain-containing protein [Opitutae bacterium]